MVQLARRRKMISERKIDFEKLSENFKKFEKVKKINPDFEFIRAKLENVCGINIAEEYRRSVKSYKAQIKQEKWELKVILDSFFENFEPIFVVFYSLL